jgi:hypothetical protein
MKSKVDKPRYRWRCYCACGINFADKKPGRMVCPVCKMPADWERVEVGGAKGVR